MALAGDPVTTGLVDSLNRPGGNITGMAGVTAELSGKSVELIREMLPSAHRVVALANAPDPFSKPFLERIRLAGVATGTMIDAKFFAAPKSSMRLFRKWRESDPMPSSFNPACRANVPPSWRSGTE
jgi:putative ABC transport system substrate-binding protein